MAWHGGGCHTLAGGLSGQPSLALPRLPSPSFRAATGPPTPVPLARLEAWGVGGGLAGLLCVPSPCPQKPATVLPRATLPGTDAAHGAGSWHPPLPRPSPPAAPPRLPGCLLCDTNVCPRRVLPRRGCPWLGWGPRGDPWQQDPWMRRAGEASGHPNLPGGPPPPPVGAQPLAGHGARLAAGCSGGAAGGCRGGGRQRRGCGWQGGAGSRRQWGRGRERRPATPPCPLPAASQAADVSWCLRRPRCQVRWQTLPARAQPRGHGRGLVGGEIPSPRRDHTGLPGDTAPQPGQR